MGAWLSEVSITKDDVLYAIGSNHSVDGPDITAIDLKAFVPTIDNLSNGIEDAFYDANSPRYIASSKQLFELESYGERNPVVFDGKVAAAPIRLWRELAPENIDNSSVVGLYWDENNHLHGICGDKKGLYLK